MVCVGVVRRLRVCVPADSQQPRTITLELYLHMRTAAVKLAMSFSAVSRCSTQDIVLGQPSMLATPQSYVC